MIYRTTNYTLKREPAMSSTNSQNGNAILMNFGWLDTKPYERNVVEFTLSFDIGWNPTRVYIFYFFMNLKTLCLFLSLQDNTLVSLKVYSLESEERPYGIAYDNQSIAGFIIVQPYIPFVKSGYLNSSSPYAIYSYIIYFIYLFILLIISNSNIQILGLTKLVQ